MSILIKGIEMPESCHKCPCHAYEPTYMGTPFQGGYFKCNVLNRSLPEDMYHSRLNDCPLEEQVMELSECCEYRVGNECCYPVVNEIDGKP